MLPFLSSRFYMHKPDMDGLSCILHCKYTEQLIILWERMDMARLKPHLTLLMRVLRFTIESTYRYIYLFFFTQIRCAYMYIVNYLQILCLVRIVLRISVSMNSHYSVQIVTDYNYRSPKKIYKSVPICNKLRL